MADEIFSGSEQWAVRSEQWNRDKEMGGRSELKVEAVPGFGFLPQKVVAATDLLFQVELLDAARMD